MENMKRQNVLKLQSFEISTHTNTKHLQTQNIQYTVTNAKKNILFSLLNKLHQKGTAIISFACKIVVANAQQSI